MNVDPRKHLGELVTLLKATHITTRELKGVLRELSVMAVQTPALADEIQPIRESLEDRIRRKAL